MKCSLIIPAYKSSRFVDKAVESVLNQSIDNEDSIQIILVSDGCEESYRSAEKYSDNILCLLLCSNHGVYNAINLGLTYVDESSDLIGTMGSDDVWGLNRIRRTKEEWINNTSNGIFSCPAKIIDEQGFETGESMSCAPSGQNIYTSDVIKMLGMYKPWRCGADTEYQLRCKRIDCSKTVVENCLFYYRAHENQLTKSKETGFGSEIRAGYASLIEELKENKDSEPLFQRYPTPKVAEHCGVAASKTLKELLYLSDID